MQVSRTPRARLEWCARLPGVGEALKREIAGWFWAGQLGLWGIEACVCFRFGWAGCVREVRVLRFITGFAGLWAVCVASQRIGHLLHPGFWICAGLLGRAPVWREAEAGTSGDTREVRADFMRRASTRKVVLGVAVVVRTLQR